MFKVDNPKIKQLMNNLAVLLTSQMPKGWGFTLLIFEFNADKDNNPVKSSDSLFYISDANREDMIATMKQFIAESEARFVTPPGSFTKKQ